jgi:hypothetical protein
MPECSIKTPQVISNWVQHDFRGIHLKHSASEPDLSGVRPTLLSKPKLMPLEPAGNGEDSILSASKMGVLSSKSGSPSNKPVGFTFFAVLAISAAAAFLGYQYLSSSTGEPTLASVANDSAGKTSVASAGPISSLSEAGTGAASPATGQPESPLLASPPPPSASVAMAPDAAQIINEAHPSHNTPSATGEGKLAMALEEGVKPPAAALKNALENATPTGATAPQLRSSPQTEKTTAVADKKASATGKARAAGTTKTPAEAPDKDVNLLAALLAHNNGVAGQPSPTVRPLVTAKPGTIPAPQKTNALSSPASEKVARTSTAPSREVVERQASESTAALLKRCGTFGFIEGELCRMRICSGLWDSDAACKARLSSNASTAPDSPKH